MDEFPSYNMLFINSPPRRRRLPAFAASVLMHCILIVVMSQWSVRAPTNVHQSPTRKYSVRFLRLQMPSEYRREAPAGENRSGAAELGRSARSQTSASHAHAASTAPPGQSAPPQPSIARDHRQFQLPPQARVQPVTQTLVQIDLPPQIALKHEIPLPTVVLWTQIKPLPPMRRQFVAPPAKKVPVVPQSLPAAVALDVPNQEINVANVNVAAAILNNISHPIHPPTIASPVSSPGDELAKEIPQIGLTNSSQPSAANLISLPNTPLRSAAVLGVPPANQIAPHDLANAGSATGDGGAGQALHGSGGRGSGVSGPDAGELGIQGKGGGSVSGSLPGGTAGKELGSSKMGTGLTTGTGSTGETGSGTAFAGNGGSGTTSRASGAGSSNNGAGNDSALGNGISGVTRIDLPKDGKFGVVVLGSAGSARYPEAAGALGGKIVYTVYLRVGLRKNWILQYCLPRTVENSKGHATAVDAPWPFLIMRPDRWSASDPDYIMMHGMITSAGHFDQIEVVFPNELEKKDLLLSSLKTWAFRPASLDGEPTPVEVLLIIPREVE